jgi:ribosomal protein S3
MRGKVPLNTLSVKLDYFFFTIPIKNSAISIKIILYKNLYIEKFKRSLTF